MFPQLGSYNPWVCVLSVLVLVVVPDVAQGQTIPGGSASKPGGAPGGGGGSDDNQECVYYGIPPEFEIRPGEGKYSELWYRGRYHAYDYDPASKIAYPPYGKQSAPYFGPFGPVHVVHLSSMTERALNYYHSQSSKVRGPLSEAEAAYVERLNNRRAWITAGANVAAGLQTIAAARAGIARQPLAVVAVPPATSARSSVVFQLPPSNPPIRMSVNRQAGSLFPKSRPPRKGTIAHQLDEAGTGSRFRGTNPSFRRLREDGATVDEMLGAYRHDFHVHIPRSIPESVNLLTLTRAYLREVESGGNLVLNIMIHSRLTSNQVRELWAHGIYFDRADPPFQDDLVDTLYDKTPGFFTGRRLYSWGLDSVD